MFGIDSTELLVIVMVAVVVIGPKDLPRALYKIGQVVGKARGMARHFRTGLDAMVREAELEELQKQWAKENERIMAAHPVTETMMTEKPIVDEALSDASDDGRAAIEQALLPAVPEAVDQPDEALVATVEPMPEDRASETGSETGKAQ